jgi:hypothetical protein
MKSSVERVLLSPQEEAQRAQPTFKLSVVLTGEEMRLLEQRRYEIMAEGSSRPTKTAIVHAAVRYAISDLEGLKGILAEFGSP